MTDRILVQEMKWQAIIVAVCAYHSDLELANFLNIASSLVQKIQMELETSATVERFLPKTKNILNVWTPQKHRKFHSKSSKHYSQWPWRMNDNHCQRTSGVRVDYHKCGIQGHWTSCMYWGEANSFQQRRTSSVLFGEVNLGINASFNMVYFGSLMRKNWLKLKV